MKIEDLAPEQADQFQACKTYEEFMAIADEVGLELDEDQDEALRMLFDNPEVLAELMAKASAEDEDADITEDELKAVAGGYDMSGYVVTITKFASPAYVRGQVQKIHDKYMTSY